MNPEPQGHPDDVFTPAMQLECPPLTQNITIVPTMLTEIALLAQEGGQNNAIGQS